jgi:hypothetical protein
MALRASQRSPPPFEVPRNGEFGRPAEPASPVHWGTAKLEEGELLVKPASAKGLPTR